jgi:arylsulfatase A-like enzyme
LNALTHVTDVVPTILEVAGVANPGTNYKGRTLHPITGKSLVKVLQDNESRVRGKNDRLGDEQNEHRYIVRDNYKAVWLGPPYGASMWELFHIKNDRAESTTWLPASLRCSPI